MSLLDELQQIKESKYKEFIERLVPTQYEILGVRMPQMQLIAKNINYSDITNPQTFEEVMIKGFTMGKTEGRDELLRQIIDFLPYIDNWSLTDSVICRLKLISKEKEFFYKKLSFLLKSQREFDLRFIIIVFIDFYLEMPYFDRVALDVANIKSSHYYVKMAQAWFFSVAYLKNENVFAAMESLDNWTFNKSVQKIIESKRINNEKKAYLKQKKR